LVVLVFVFVVTGFVPAWRHLNSDFPNYYLIARLYRQGYPLERVYEWTWLQRQKGHQGIDQPLVSFIPSTLPSALVVLPWSSLPPLQAKRRWLIVNLGFLLAIAVLISAITKLNLIRIALLMFLAVIPLRDSVLYGQMHILVLLLLTLAAWLYFKDSFFSSGMVLAIAATLKIYPALFLIFFAFKKQWRAAIGLIVGLSIAALISLRVFGRNACLVYVQEVLPRGLRGETIDPYSVAWNSLSALLRRLFIAEPELNPAPVVHAPVLYALLHPLIHGFIFVAFMWVIGSRTGDRARGKVEWAAYLFLLLLLSSQPGPYHFVALILTAVLVIDCLVAHQQAIKAGAVATVYALICGPLVRLPRIHAAGWSNLLLFPRLALMVLLGVVLLWILLSISPESLGGRFNLRASLLAAFALVTLIGLGFISNVRHLRGQFDNYNSRAVTVPDSLMASDPVVTSQGLLFTEMTSRGYAIRRLSAGSVTDFLTTGGDWFHLTGLTQTDAAWAEQSSRSGSRIMGFSSQHSTQDPKAGTIEADNAEQPVVSPDGELLAFIREANGRGSLWTQLVRRAEHQDPAIGEREIAGTEYDVRDMSFAPGHGIVFSSRSAGRFALYVAELSGSIEKMRTPICSARYPAVSPDGHWIAFSCEERGSWQIHVMNLQSSEESQLTNSECNSISPAWMPDSEHVVYATDCGRGLGLTALAELTVFH
jgi:Glycosyltransferase family 87/WD40-like Beta Propeller Repeat